MRRRSSRRSGLNSRLKHRSKSSRNNSGGRLRGSARTRSSASRNLRRERKTKKMTASFHSPKSSVESMDRVLRESESPVIRTYLYGLLGILVLLLSGTEQEVLSMGLAVFVSGCMLILYPPKLSLGRTINLGMGILLVAGLFAFVPMFYWPVAQWRADAVSLHSIKLPWLSSIQPAVTGEHLILLMAGLSWFYVLATSRVNGGGWRRFFLAVNLIILVASLVLIFGPSKEMSPLSGDLVSVKSIFFGLGLTENFLGLGTLISACYGLRAITKKKTSNIFSLFVSIFSVFALFRSGYTTALFLFFTGLLIWLLGAVIRMPDKHLLKRSLRWLVLPVLLACFFTGNVWSSLIDSASEVIREGVENRASVYLDCLTLIRETPLFGIGLGNFSAVFPQYCLLSRSSGEMNHPQSDLLWVLAEGGFFFLLGIIITIWGYYKLCNKLSPGQNRRYRSIVFLAAVLFFVHSLIDVPGRHFATVYLALLYAALVVPVRALQPSKIPTMSWRIIGAFFILHGLLWVSGALFKLPTHSVLRAQLIENQLAGALQDEAFENAHKLTERALKERPLDWQLHHKNGVLALAFYRDKEAATKEFNRASFCQPILSIVRYEEGFAWLDYDLSQTTEAWENAISRLRGDPLIALTKKKSMAAGNNENIYKATTAWSDAIVKSDTEVVQMFRNMIQNSRNKPLMMDRLADLSKVDTIFRKEYLMFLVGNALLEEMEEEFLLNPGLLNFRPEDRSDLVIHWMEYAEISQVESFLQVHGNRLFDPWKVRAKFLSLQGIYSKAIELVASNITVNDLPEFRPEEIKMNLLERSFAAMPNNFEKGFKLLSIYFYQNEYEKALRVIEKMQESEVITAEVYYWKAELLRRLGKTSDSWSAFEEYINR